MRLDNHCAFYIQSDLCIIQVACVFNTSLPTYTSFLYRPFCTAYKLHMKLWKEQLQLNQYNILTRMVDVIDATMIYNKFMQE